TSYWDWSRCKTAARLLLRRSVPRLGFDLSLPFAVVDEYRAFAQLPLLKELQKAVQAKLNDRVDHVKIQPKNEYGNNHHHGRRPDLFCVRVTDFLHLRTDVT